MKIWVDDVRPAPDGYVWRKSVNAVKRLIKENEHFDTQLVISTHSSHFDTLHLDTIELIDLDHDSGDFVYDGGDYINILNWLEETGRNYPIRIHSMNPVGVENMRRIIKKNGWKEIKGVLK